jgi:hypothetical protein
MYQKVIQKNKGKARSVWSCMLCRIQAQAKTEFIWLFYLKPPFAASLFNKKLIFRS